MPGAVPVVANTSVILSPLDATKHNTPDSEAVQAKVVPVMLLVNPIAVGEPEQMACIEGVATTSGMRSTVTVAVPIIKLLQIPTVLVAITK